MAAIPRTIHGPGELWQAAQAFATDAGDTNTVTLRAAEEYVTASARRKGRHSQLLVQVLSTPVAALNLSARTATALRTLNVRYVYELVTLAPTDLRRQLKVGEKSVREIKAKLATLGLTLGMPVDEDTYRAAVVTAVAAHMQAARKG